MRLLIYILVLTIPFHTAAQTLTVKASSSTIGLGQRVKITYTLEGEDGSKFVQPTFNGFRLLSGPNSASNMQWVNGKFSSSKTISFVLLAQKLGSHSIGPASIKVKGKSIKSDVLKLTVVDAKQAKKTQAKQRGNQQASADQIDLSTRIFLKLFVSKRDVFVGEQLVATYKLYSNVNFENQGIEIAPFNGFYAEDAKIGDQYERKRETINGKQFDVYTVKRSLLTAQQNGNIQVPPMTMDFVVQIRTNKRRGFFDPWGGYKNISYTAKSNTQNIEVSPLPTSNQPADFAGAVGQFKLRIEQDRKSVNLNEAVNLKLKIEGNGNLELIGEPKVSFPQDFETYEPKLTESITVTSAGSKGYKTYDYVLIPRFAGDFKIDPITISYFNPKTEQYERTSTEPIEVEVAKTINSENGNEIAYVSAKKEEVQILGKDIRYIHQLEFELAPPNESFFGSPGFVAMTALPFSSMALALLLIAQVRKRGADIGALKMKKASSVAKKRLQAAENELNHDGAKFYEEVFKALYGYIGDKFGLDPADHSKEKIAEELQRAGCKSELIENLLKAIESCELARFAPSQAMDKGTDCWLRAHKS